jgi:hypothetical protein
LVDRGMHNRVFKPESRRFFGCAPGGLPRPAWPVTNLPRRRAATRDLEMALRMVEELIWAV